MEPRILPCSHCLCTGCIQDLWDHAKGQGKSGIECPECRQYFKVSGYINRPFAPNSTRFLYSWESGKSLSDGLESAQNVGSWELEGRKYEANNHLGMFHLESSTFSEKKIDQVRLILFQFTYRLFTVININEMAINYLPKSKNQRKVSFLNETLPFPPVCNALFSNCITFSAVYKLNWAHAH